jgi:hypothetical protein
MNAQGFGAAGEAATSTAGGAASNLASSASTSGGSSAGSTSSSSGLGSSQTSGTTLGSAGNGATSTGGSSGSASASGGAGGTAAGGGAGSGGAVAEPSPPPAGAFFADDFEAGTPGTQPAGWTRWIDYSTSASNTLTGPQYALLDDQDSVSGGQSVHFHATGNTQPAMLTRVLPPGTNRLHLRVFVKTTVQQGSRPPDNPSNHDTLIALRATPNDGNFEIRFGETKGALGFNMVGPGRNDAVAPLPALWGSAPLLSPGTWHCLELEFSNEDPDRAEAHASVDGQLVRSVTSAADWHVPLGDEGTRWLDGMFNEVVLGWQSFSNPPANDVWMDDLVLSDSPIGCD